MKYLVAGNIIINDVYYTDGRVRLCQKGGAVSYALYGINCVTEDVLFVGETGKNFDEFYGEWMRDNNLSSEALALIYDECPYLGVHYFENGLWEHRPVLNPQTGKNYNESLLPCSVGQISKFSKGAAGISFNCSCADEYAPFWEELFELQKKDGFKIMWEIATQLFKPEYRECVLENIAKVDIYSMNLEEARILFDIEDEEEVIRKIKDIKVPCFFRAGEKGAYMIEGEKCVFVPSLLEPEGVDPTGCGNSSTAVSMVGYLEEWDFAKIVATANAVATVNARQFGLYPKVTDDTRKEIAKMAEEMTKKAVVC